MLHRPGQKVRLIPIHRLVLFAFVGPPPEGYIGHHKNENPQDNKLENLEWATASTNTSHAYQWGRIPLPDNRGENSGRSKLTAAQVVQIRFRHASGERAQLLADTYGVCPNTIRSILKGKTWSHI